MLLRIICLALCRKRPCQRYVSVGVLRLERYGPLEPPCGRLKVALLRQSDAKIEMCPCNPWIKLDGFAKLLDTAFKITLFRYQLHLYTNSPRRIAKAIIISLP